MMAGPRNVPGYHVPAVDPKTGLWSREWYPVIEQIVAAMRSMVTHPTNITTGALDQGSEGDEIGMLMPGPKGADGPRGMMGPPGMDGADGEDVFILIR